MTPTCSDFGELVAWGIQLPVGVVPPAYGLFLSVQSTVVTRTTVYLREDACGGNGLSKKIVAPAHGLSLGV